MSSHSPGRCCSARTPLLVTMTRPDRDALGMGLGDPWKLRWRGNSRTHVEKGRDSLPAALPGSCEDDTRALNDSRGRGGGDTEASSAKVSQVVKGPCDFCSQWGPCLARWRISGVGTHPGDILSIFAEPDMIPVNEGVASMIELFAYHVSARADRMV